MQPEVFQYQVCFFGAGVISSTESKSMTVPCPHNPAIHRMHSLYCVVVFPIRCVPMCAFTNHALLSLQVTNPRLQCDFFAMAAAKEWRDQVKPIADLCIRHIGAGSTLQRHELQDLAEKVEAAMQVDAAHEACPALTAHCHCQIHYNPSVWCPGAPVPSSLA